MNTMLKKTISFFVWAFLLVSLPACSVDDAKDYVGMHVDKSRSIVVLVDLSTAQHFPERHSFFGGIIEKEVLANLGLDDRLSILPIDRASLSNAEEMFLVDLSKEKGKLVSKSGPVPAREKETQKNLENRKNELLADFQSRYEAIVKARAPLSVETDIFGALEGVGKYVVADRPVILIMLSDMMHHSKNLSMEPSGTNLSKEKVNALLQKAPKVNLRGYQLLVLTGDQTPNQSGHFEAVQLFWTKYFAENGATLIDYSSAARSKVVEAMQNSKSK